MQVEQILPVFSQYLTDTLFLPNKCEQARTRLGFLYHTVKFETCLHEKNKIKGVLSQNQCYCNNNKLNSSEMMNIKSHSAFILLQNFSITQRIWLFKLRL